MIADEVSSVRSDSSYVDVEKVSSDEENENKTATASAEPSRFIK